MNFYAIHDECPCCGRNERIHLGKRSGTRRFMFQASRRVRNFGDWKSIVEAADRLEDEYHRPVTAEEMLAIVDEHNLGRYDEHGYLDDTGHFFIDADFS